MPPAKRRKMEALLTGQPPEEEVQPPEKSDSMMADSADQAEEGGEMPMSEESETLMASAGMLQGKKVGDTVTFKVMSIDPKTGGGSLEPAETMES